MKFSKRLVFRSAGKLYMLVEHAGVLKPRKNAGVPVSVKPFPKHADDVSGDSCGDVRDENTQWVIMSPYLDGVKRGVLELEDSCGDLLEVPVSYMAAKWESRINWRIRRRRCETVVAAAKLDHANMPAVEILCFLPKDDKVIWRIRIDCAKELRSDIAIKVGDGLCREVPFTSYPFETQEVALDDGIEIVRRFYSLELPRDLKCFSVVACFGGVDSVSGFASVDARLYHHMEHLMWMRTNSASDDEERYRRWYKQHGATAKQLALQADTTFSYMPMISVIVPCFCSDERYLERCIASVLAHSYAHWELVLVDGSAAASDVVQRVVSRFSDDRIRLVSLEGNEGIVGNTNAGIKASQGDWVAFLDHDDLLAPDALFCYVEQINADEAMDALYCDEDAFEQEGGFKWPVFKDTVCNLDLLYSHNCVTHFLAVKRSMLEAIGLSCSDVAGAQDYDLTLRIVAAGGKVAHVSRVLYHWRCHADSTAGDNVESKPYADEAGRLALEQHFAEREIPATVETTDHPFVYRVRYTIPEPHPLVSVVIPSKDHIDELDACIRSIMERSTYREFEIVVVENNSTDVRTFEYYERIQHEYGQVRVISWEGGFNYSAIINYGVSKASGSRLLLLNNDTEVISPDFMAEMLGYLERPEVGVVGAKLYFRDELVQHAGIEVGPFDVIVHVNQDFTRDRMGYRGRAVRPGNFSAVTGACQMVRRDVFEQVGGYDEAFAVGFNDADFCMRAYEAGYLTVFTPYAELYHYEFTSRGRETADAAKLVRWEHERDLFHERWRKYFTEGDPFSNPNLSLKSAYYALPE